MGYIVQLQDIRDKGLTVAMASDDEVNATILIYEQVWERMTGQFFEPRAADLRFDGDNSDTYLAPIPIITVSSLTLNDDTGNATPLEADEFTAYTNRTQYPDDRGNPRIVLRRGRRFVLGRSNQRLVGTFGYTEADDSVPLPVKQAVCKLVIEKLLTPPVNDPQVPLPDPNIDNNQGALTEEVTDDHKRKWSAFQAPLKPSVWGGITQNREIIAIANMYRAPIGIATQADFQFLYKNSTPDRVLLDQIFS